MIKAIKKLSFNQKATLVAIYLGVLICAWQASEARQERIKAQEAKAATMQLAVEAADMAALMATFAGWGINSVPNFADRDQFYSMTLSNSVDLVRLTGREPSDFAGVRQLQGLVNYLKGYPGIVNRPPSAALERGSGMKQRD